MSIISGSHRMVGIGREGNQTQEELKLWSKQGIESEMSYDIVSSLGDVEWSGSSTASHAGASRLRLTLINNCNMGFSRSSLVKYSLFQRFKVDKCRIRPQIMPSIPPTARVLSGILRIAPCITTNQQFGDET